MKYLRITMPDGSKWDVPARIIAKDRATYLTVGQMQESWVNGEKEIVEY